jgi:hypothetical protein
VTAAGQSVSRSGGQGGCGRRGKRLSGIIRAAALASVVLSHGGNLRAQIQASDSSTARPPDRLTVYLMTMGPGKHVWERFGHNAIWIHDPAQGTDQTYNYGLFDFHQQNFLLRFVQGRMWYWMRGYPAQSYVESYRRANRSVWIQELEIPPAARRELQQFLEWNELPENRFYHYDYYRDNCSTRVRDALDQALGGVIRAATAAAPTERTYRFHTQRLTANDPPIYTGLLLALGHPVDRPISQWEEMFLPLAMREHVRSIRVTGLDGRSVPLVRSEQTLFQSTEPEPSAAPPSWTLWYLLGGLGIGGAALGLALQARTSGVARAGFLAVTWSWLVLSGLGGLVLAGLWGLTDHAAAYRNENVLQFDLLALPLIWLVTRLAFGSTRFARATLVLAVAVAAISVLGLLLKFLPPFYQVNHSIIALAVPAHAGIAAAVWTLAHKPKLIPSTAASTTSAGAT